MGPLRVATLSGTWCPLGTLFWLFALLGMGCAGEGAGPALGSGDGALLTDEGGDAGPVPAEPERAEWCSKELVRGVGAGTGAGCCPAAAPLQAICCCAVQCLSPVPQGDVTLDDDEGGHDVFRRLEVALQELAGTAAQVQQMFVPLVHYHCQVVVLALAALVLKVEWALVVTESSV
ncbi:Protein of unknown function [Gryllus bimaculatus]|nr:Protein of unknown function [Gryllus bimaculatus]